MASNQIQGANKQAILVIDDEEVVRVLFQSLLDEEGFTTLLAQDGREGIQMLDQHGPAVALVDKNLPDISGLELIATEKKRHPDTEFIMITGFASLDSAVRAMEVGAFSYLTKPFEDMDVVLDRIRAAMEVNNLRTETSHLRERLKKLSGESPVLVAPAKPDHPFSELSQQVNHTLSFLESFLNKRDQPPPASIWSHMIDMMEERCRLLKQALESDEKPSK